MSWRILVFLILPLLCWLAPQAKAATSISITEKQSLTFPLVGLPASGGTSAISINPLNSATTGTAQIISGIPSRGTYDLSAKGGRGISISIDISGITTDSAGLTLSNFRGFYGNQQIDSFPSSTLALPASAPATTPLYLGATVSANASVPAGNHTGSFTITVFVQ